MYFVRYAPLKEKLRERALPDREAMPYLLATFLVMTLAMLPSSLEVTLADRIEWGLSGIITVLGIFYVYRMNGGRNGFDLIQKATVLGWIAAVRLFLMVLVITIPLFYFNLAVIEESKVTTWTDTAVVVALEIVYFQRLGHHIRDTR